VLKRLHRERERERARARERERERGRERERERERERTNKQRYLYLLQYLRKFVALQKGPAVNCSRLAYVHATACISEQLR